MTAPEPHLGRGDSGESVLRLQARLQALNLYVGPVDGTFGEETVIAVKSLQEAHGVAASGEADEHTWTALAQAEDAAAPTGLSAGAEPSFTEGVATPIGTLSEDQHWRWDGERWQANGELLGVEQFDGASNSRLSGDGHWLWDGKQWQPVNR
jgi:hypothetical protein